jgi:hypothetical protein
MDTRSIARARKAESYGLTGNSWLTQDYEFLTSPGSATAYKEMLILRGCFVIRLISCSRLRAIRKSIPNEPGAP